MRVEYSLVNALITPLAHYHLFAICGFALSAAASFPQKAIGLSETPMSQLGYLNASALPHRGKPYGLPRYLYSYQSVAESIDNNVAVHDNRFYFSFIN